MKPYKIDLSGFTGKVREVVSEAVQKKAFDLGYKWPCGGKVVQHTNYPSLFANKDGSVKKTDTEGYFDTDPNSEITADAFLALTTAKDEPEFKPFDKVLVRNTDGQEWLAGLFAKRNSEGSFEDISYNEWNHCIPYEGNEALLGTTDSPE